MHRPNNRYGENIALYGWFFQSSKFSLPDNIIDFSAELWYNQKYQYQYQLRPLGPGSDHRTIHYTQMVSSNICAMGCGAALCDALEGYGGRPGWSIVCNYSPPGNVMGKTPYEYGSSCSKCPLGPGTCTSYGLCQGQCAGVRIPPASANIPFPAAPPTAPAPAPAPTVEAPTAPPKSEAIGKILFKKF